MEFAAFRKSQFRLGTLKMCQILATDRCISIYIRGHFWLLRLPGDDKSFMTFVTMSLNSTTLREHINPSRFRAALWQSVA